jgi:hypothetical protein
MVTTDGLTTSNMVQFTVFQQMPGITMLSVSMGVQASTVNLTITGTNLSGTTSVNFTGSGVTVQNTSSTATTVTTQLVFSGTAAVGPQTISVTTPGGTSNTEPFTVIAALAFSPSPLSFNGANAAYVDCGLTPAPAALPSPCPAQTVTLSNNNASSLTLSAIPATSTGSGEFAITNTCPASLAPAGQPNSTCTITLTFEPTMAGARSPASDSLMASGTIGATGVSSTLSISGKTLDWVGLTFSGDSTDISFNIYRQTILGVCTPPSSSTYTKIGSVNNAFMNTAAYSFPDTNSGAGLAHGTTYCYSITGFNGSAESAFFTPAQSATP